MFLLNLLILLALCGNAISQTQRQSFNWEIYRQHEHTPYTFERIVELMRSYYEEATPRIARLNPIRFMYEESPYYEMGYIIGEIIERYRKVLEYTQKSKKFKFIIVPDLVKNVESVQRLYLELHHLVSMLHETPRKWRQDPEFVDIEKIAGYELVNAAALSGVKLGGAKGGDGAGGAGGAGGGAKGAMGGADEQSKLHKLLEVDPALKSVKVYERKLAEERKRLRKKLDKMRQAFLQGFVIDGKGGKEYNKTGWPLNYKGAGEKRPYNKKWPLDYGWEIYSDW